MPAVMVGRPLAHVRIADDGYGSAVAQPLACISSSTSFLSTVSATNASTSVVVRSVGTVDQAIMEERSKLAVV